LDGSGELGSRVNIEFREQVTEVSVHGVHGQVEPFGGCLGSRSSAYDLGYREFRPRQTRPPLWVLIGTSSAYYACPAQLRSNSGTIVSRAGTIVDLRC
jgi:hypothetical protein